MPIPINERRAEKKPGRWQEWRRRRATRARERDNNGGRHVTGRQRAVRVLIIFLTAVTICGYLDRSDIDRREGGGVGFSYFERFPHRVRLAMAWSRHSDQIERARNSIVLLAISDDTFDAENPAHLPGPPVPRNYHARMIRELTQAGAKAIAFDLIFDLPSEHDAELAAAARESGKVFWASLFEDENDPQAQAILPTDQLLQAVPRYGHIHVPQKSQIPEVDRLRAVIKDNEGRPVPAFSLGIAMLAQGWKDQSLRQIGQTWRAGEIDIPVDAEGNFIISFLGKPDQDSQDSVFSPVSYENVYQAAVDSNNRRGLVDDAFYGKNNFFKDKIVIIGNSTRVGNDFRTTAAGYMWGPEIHAHALATMLMEANGGRPIVHEVPDSINLLVLVVLTALVCPLAATWRLQWAALATALLLLAYAVFNIWLFIDYGILLHLVAPAASVLLATLGVLTERGLTEEREKNRMHGLLQRYVSPQVAAYLVAHPERMGLGGQSVTASVLFSDIRGFTSMSEKLTPTEVLARLNEYLQAMTDVVFVHDGAVDKYIGDAIMAHYGTLLRQPDHARRAVATAIDMQTALLELQANWQAQGLPLIDIGIGINTGDMVVGNMGSVQRTDFSVIGDCVNLASRVESLNKEMGSRILITASTYEAVKDEVEVRGPLTATVKGKEEVVEVYEVYGWKNIVAIADA